MNEMNQSLTELDLWEPPYIELPERSRLHCLEPKGIGTPYVESLTSYISRLAASHDVPVVSLVSKEIKPKLPASYQGEGQHYRNIYPCAIALNGLGIMAKDWIHALQALTLRQDLQYSTMLNWEQVLPTQGLLRFRRAWCPDCYTEGRDTKQTIYEPLLWAIKEVNICLHHCRRLNHQCPHCNKNLPHLDRYYRSGYCSKCARWLGSSTKGIDLGDNELQEGELEWEKWVASNIGELLSFSGQFVTPKRERVAKTLSTFAKKSPKGNFYSLGRWLKMGPYQVSFWCKGRHLPQLLPAIHICYRLSISLKDFYTGENVIRDINGNPNLPNVPYRIKRIKKPLDREELKRTLEMILASEEYPPPSMAVVATRLEIEYRRLCHHFPELCREIASKYRRYRRNLKLRNIKSGCEEVERVVLMLHAEGIEPLKSRVACQMSKPRYLREKAVMDFFVSFRRSLGYGVD